MWSFTVESEPDQTIFTPVPKAVEEHQKGKAGEREAWSKPHSPLRISYQASTDVVEEQHPHHNNAKHDLDPKANPAHPPQPEGQLLKIEAVSHAGAQLVVQTWHHNHPVNNPR